MALSLERDGPLVGDGVERDAQLWGRSAIFFWSEKMCDTPFDLTVG